MGHGHDHGEKDMADGRLIAAVGINLLLTIAQVIGGIISGSLSLVADALHNFSDAASLVIALFARKIGRKPPDELRTFGYKRAEIIAALINLVTLVIVGVYLIYEALWRFFKPEMVEGWLVIIVASIALIIDVVTAILTYNMSKNSVNMKAAFLHNLSDALSSICVIIAGSLIILYDWYWVDSFLTLLIAGYVLYQGFSMLPSTIHLLMEGTPAHLSISKVISAMEEIEGVDSVHHVHVWQLDEHHNALEAHIVSGVTQISEIEKIKTSLKSMLKDNFSVGHSTLEFEHANNTDCQYSNLR
ncbi:MAG: cation diffusion facilitator family transporter [Rickettsiales bacterium]